MVERRDQVLIGERLLASCAASAFCCSESATSGPVLMERAMP
jgi:hypothetical protein